MNSFKILENEYTRQTPATLCDRKKGSFSLQKHQEFLKYYVSSQSFNVNKRFLLYHGLGSGKTCTAISCAKSFMERYGKKSKVIVVTPASLIQNFKNEIMNECGSSQFKAIKKTVGDVSKNEQPCEVSAKRETNKIIDSLFSIMSYQSFIKQLSNKRFFPFRGNVLIIIDEVQNIISATGSMYTVIKNAIVDHKSSDKIHLILMSGTPIFDKPNELALLGNLLLKSNAEFKSKGLPVDNTKFMRRFTPNETNTSLLNEHVLYKFFQNKISYFRGSNPIAYPTKHEYHVYCPMSKYQYDGYQKAIGVVNDVNVDAYDEMSQTFLIGPRKISNVIYPNGDISQTTSLKYSTRSFDSKKYAIKFNTCINMINDSNGPVFVYSNFVSACGVNTFSDILRNEFKYSEVTPQICPLTSKKNTLRYAVFKTGQPLENTRILQIYNSPKNKDGSLIKIILGSPAMKEGVSLLRVRQVHLLDPYWNRSRTEQIMGRAIRFCSHKDLPVNERNVNVYHYYAVDPSFDTNQQVVIANKVVTNIEHKTVDVHIQQMGVYKGQIASAFTNILKNSAFDCDLFKAANENTIMCRTYPTTVPSNNTDRTYDDNIEANITRQRLNALSKIRNERIERNVSIIRNNSDNTFRATPKPKASKSATNKVYKQIKFGNTTSKSYGKSRPLVGKGCPTTRRPDPVTFECPSNFPYKRLNKHGIPCCFKRQGLEKGDKEMKNCMKKRKNVLLNEAVPYGYTGGVITKTQLCNLIMSK